MELEITSGMWLQKRRKALDLTREELARCAGCSVSALRKIETDERRPSKQLAMLLAGCLKIPPADQVTFVRLVRSEFLHEQLEFPDSLVVGNSIFEHPGLVSPTDLRAFPSPLVGRASELSALMQFLRDPSCRLLTLTGLGGIGKTRLAIEAAANIQRDFRDGVYSISLASLNSTKFILTAIAGALSFSFYGSTDTKTQLFSYLSHKSLLMVLDNFDCLVEAGGLLTEILEQSPDVKLLVTSRERLNLTKEWVFELYGLPIPPAGSTWEGDDYDSVALFVQVARQKQADFVLSGEDKSAVSHICRLLEGMPLGIELAASWIQVLSCQEIAQEIERSLDFLASTLRDVPEHHRSLRAVFDRSWNLLTSQERHVLSGLTMFPGGFYRLAAERVCQASLPLLSTLVSKSLVSKKGGSRYDLHQIVRQYAADYLHTHPKEEKSLRERHACFYLTWIKEHEAALTSNRQKEFLEQLTFEIDNLRQAWEWAIDQREIMLLREAAWAFWYSYELRGLFREGEAIFHQAVQSIRSWNSPNELEDDARLATLSYLQIFKAYLALRQGRLEAAGQLFKDSMDLLQRTNDRVGLANAFLMYGVVCMFMGQFQEAIKCLQEALDHALATNRKWELSLSRVIIGRVEYQLGDYTESKNWINEGLALGQKMGDPNLITFSTSTLVETMYALGQLDEMEILLREGLQVATDNGSRFTYGMLQEQLAMVVHSTGNTSEANQLCQASVDLYTELGDEWSLSRALNLFGSFKLEEDEPTQALHFYLDALKVACKAQAYANALDALTGIAALQATNQNDLLAVELTMHILQDPNATHQAQDTCNRLVKELKARLTPEQIKAVKASVRAQSFDQIVKKVATWQPADLIE